MLKILIVMLIRLILELIWISMLGLLEVGPLKPFFHLTSTFFGLTSNYKVPLLEEIYLCTQHLKGVTYNDVLSMPTYERRFFIGMLTKTLSDNQERAEEQKEKAKTQTGKGSRQTNPSQKTSNSLRESQSNKFCH